MQRFLSANRLLLRGLGFAFLFELALALGGSSLAHTVRLPSGVGPSKTVQAQMLILIPDDYTLFLAFDRDAPMERFVDSLFNSDPSPSKAHLPVRWSLRKLGMAPQFVETTDHPRGYFTGYSLGVALSQVRLGAGWYFFEAEFLPGFPDLPAMNPKLELNAHPKLAATWQRAAFNLVSLAQLIVIPTMLIMVAILTSRLIGTCWPRSGAHQDGR